MTSLAAAALALALALSTVPALAQANGNLAPGAVANGSGAALNAAEGTQPNGQPMPEGAGGVGNKTATNGQNMKKEDLPAGTKGSHGD